MRNNIKRGMRHGSYTFDFISILIIFKSTFLMETLWSLWNSFFSEEITLILRTKLMFLEIEIVDQTNLFHFLLHLTYIY